jgi:hypothetical protein
MSQEEIEDKIRILYPDMYTSELSAITGWPVSKIYNYVAKHGIKKSEEWRQKDYLKRAKQLESAGAKYRFPKGHKTYNKGKKMDPALKDKIKHTFFQKGQTPMNVNYDGHERIDKDGYTMIRIAPNKYVKKHRHIWEQANGKIPKGYIVVFKDKNKQNIVLENLEIITKEENIKRNNIHRYPQEIIQTIKLISKIKKRINEKQN